KSRIDRLAKTPNFRNFDLEFSPAGHIMREILYTYDETVFRLTNFEYDAAGRLTHTQEFDGPGARTRAPRHIYTDAGGQGIERDETGPIARHGVKEYDGERLISMTSFDGRNTLRKLKTFEYSHNRLAKSESRYYQADGTLGERWIADYNSEDRVDRTYGLKP